MIPVVPGSIRMPPPVAAQWIGGVAFASYGAKEEVLPTQRQLRVSLSHASSSGTSGVAPSAEAARRSPASRRRDRTPHCLSRSGAWVPVLATSLQPWFVGGSYLHARDDSHHSIAILAILTNEHAANEDIRVRTRQRDQQHSGRRVAEMEWLLADIAASSRA